MQDTHVSVLSSQSPAELAHLDATDASPHPCRTNVSPQHQSPFFSILPTEVRQDIYRHLWAAAGTVQHVYKTGPLAPLSHCACLTDPNAEDVREMELTHIMEGLPADEAGIMMQRDEVDDWRLRTASGWCNHWACEEEPPVMRPASEAIGDKGGDDSLRQNQYESSRQKKPVMVGEYSAFLGVLLGCKRMHQEAVDGVYDNTTFSFIGTPALSRFLATTSAVSLARIKAVHVVEKAAIETYMSLDGEDAAEAVEALLQWNDLWTTAATKLSRLQTLRICMYPQYPRYPMPLEDWFRPLHLFRHVPEYTVSLRWFMDPTNSAAGVPDFLDEAPFASEWIPPLDENPLHLHWRRLVGILRLGEPHEMPPRRQRRRLCFGRS
ncbi:hypothetical protein C8034_v010353 [Colletotrichum sidae]|uniref:DUF7730 domain-containing protein n=1 Tax=Colletotrichum sidae TaxID=1347389 RepID=A0A4R8T1C6_9PEZI|nr:hypothetical protein C8034_v010353 [Colletotrichum sidae]